MIKICNLSKRYGNKVLFENMTINISDGDFLVLTGSSGSGKTTLLNIIGGIEKPDFGYVVINGLSMNDRKDRMAAYRKELGFLFQNFALVEKMTVRENLMVVSKKNRSEITLTNALEMVGMEDSLDKKVYKLSGGEQQRVALARLLIKKCSVILADEPTGSLDKKNAEIIIELLRKINSMGKTVIMVTHNQEYFSCGNRHLELPYILAGKEGQ